VRDAVSEGCCFCCPKDGCCRAPNGLLLLDAPVAPLLSENMLPNEPPDEVCDGNSDDDDEEPPNVPNTDVDVDADNDEGAPKDDDDDEAPNGDCVAVEPPKSDCDVAPNTDDVDDDAPKGDADEPPNIEEVEEEGLAANGEEEAVPNGDELLELEL
jgi:hypothetical protein